MNDKEKLQRAIHMTNEIAQNDEQAQDESKVKRICQIVVAFQCDTDDEAMEVKKAVDSAVENHGDIQVTFTSRNFRGVLPGMRR